MQLTDTATNMNQAGGGTPFGRVNEHREETSLYGAVRVDSSHAPRATSKSLTFYPNLDSLRGIAAISVVISHIIYHFDWKTFPSIENPLLFWFRVPNLSVDLFFVISGFVVTLSSLSLFDRYPENYASIYCRRRLARIVPLHYATVILYVVLVVPGAILHPQIVLFLWANFTFTQGMFPVTHGSINGPNWSIGVEMQLYILILVLLPRIRRANPIVALAKCIVVALVWRTACFLLWNGQTSHGHSLVWLSTAQLPGTLDLFGFGIAIAMVFHFDKTGEIARRLHATRWLWVAGVHYSLLSCILGT